MGISIPYYEIGSRLVKRDEEKGIQLLLEGAKIENTGIVIVDIEMNDETKRINLGKKSLDYAKDNLSHFRMFEAYKKIASTQFEVDKAQHERSEALKMLHANANALEDKH